MFDWLVETFSTHPYIGVTIIFLACGLGLPLPEEIVLLFAGFMSFQHNADRETMMVVCALAILTGDLIPFMLGRFFGPSVLRVRFMRFLITPERLARFDRWFRRRGESVVFFSRFIAGIRMVSFFTAGTMRMSWARFLLLDLAGIVLLVPLLVWVGDHYGDTIESAITGVQKAERGVLITVLVVAAVVALWTYARWRRRQQLLVGGPAETYVEPSSPVQQHPEGGEDVAKTPADPGSPEA